MTTFLSPNWLVFMSISDSDPDFVAEVVADLYRYRSKRYPVVLVIALTCGVLGVHRFYLGKSLSGIAMLLSFGGGLVWWITDLFRLRKMVQAFNEIEALREATNLPPQGLDFLPTKQDLDINNPPSWAGKRGSRTRLIASGVLLFLLGLSLGAISGATGVIEPAITLIVFIVITLLAARLPGIAHMPLLGGLSRWSHRLRLYYHTTDPGSVWLLALRPIAGIFYAPWLSRARAEVRLYLQLGVAFAVGFALLDIAEAIERDSFGANLGAMIAEFIQTLVYTYAFVAPAGALLTTQLLLARRDRIVWGLSALTLASVYLGFTLTGP